MTLYKYLTHYFVLTHLLIMSHEKHQGLTYVTAEQRTVSLVNEEPSIESIDDIPFEKFLIKEICLVGSFWPSVLYHLVMHLTPVSQWILYSRWHLQYLSWIFHSSKILWFFKFLQTYFISFPRRGTAGASMQWSRTSQAVTVGGMGWCLSREMQVL